MDTLLALWNVDPWLQAGWICVALTFTTWLLSVVTREYSWVDRLWSVAPPVYALWVAGAAGFTDVRLTLMAVLVTAWGARLTFNFARKGGYWKGGEDYRWSIIRQRLAPWQFEVFNATFISPFQMGLIYLFTSPMHVAWQARGTPIGALDIAAAVAFLALLAVETIADEQMWAFQQKKKAAVARGERVEPGFFTGGLYSWSRHPNYFGEVGMWWVFVGFAIAAGGSWLTWTWAGPVVLTALFAGSIRFTEAISLSRYPAYAEYQKTTSMVVPWPPRAPAERART
jgi:steroid 5-alpha reductase family enzyme